MLGRKKTSTCIYINKLIYDTLKLLVRPLDNKKPKLQSTEPFVQEIVCCENKTIELQVVCCLYKNRQYITFAILDSVFDATVIQYSSLQNFFIRGTRANYLYYLDNSIVNYLDNNKYLFFMMDLEQENNCLLLFPTFLNQKIGIKSMNLHLTGISLDLL